jgi:hypothetical protein
MDTTDRILWVLQVCALERVVGHMPERSYVELRFDTKNHSTLI